jgi:hypothetical protein
LLYVAVMRVSISYSITFICFHHNPIDLNLDNAIHTSPSGNQGSTSVVPGLKRTRRSRALVSHARKSTVEPLIWHTIKISFLLYKSIFPFRHKFGMIPQGSAEAMVRWRKAMARRILRGTTPLHLMALRVMDIFSESHLGGSAIQDMLCTSPNIW